MKIVLSGIIAMFGLLGLGWWAVKVGAVYEGLAICTVAMFVLAIVLYRLRQRNRIWYGGFELLVSLLAFYVGLLTFYESSTPASLQLIVGRILIMFAAIYVMVRALDNIGTGLRGTKFEKRWIRLFS
jgi:hypothetical protein